MKTADVLRMELDANVTVLKPEPSATPEQQAFGRYFQFPWEFQEPSRPTLISNLMAHGDELLIYGPPEAGKTFYGIDLACCWATGEPWRAREVGRGLVTYLAGERSQSVKSRVLAWALRHSKGRDKIPVAVLGTSVNLLTGGDDEIAAIRDAIRAGSKIAGLPVVAIVADTVHSLSAGSKEDNHSFGVLIGQMRKLRDSIGQSEPISLVYVHHTGKDEFRGPRGGNSLPAAVSLSMAISVRLEKYRLVEIDKSNDLADRVLIEPFVIDPVTVRRDDQNQPVTIGVHVAIPITDVPDLADDELKAIALRMHREGKSQRYIAKAVGRDQSRISRWLNPETGKGSRKRRDANDAS